ncbi:hypothetical protein PI125_g23241 [Phytophthora idaei]|nr:hypothetical protein PI125_g23241 [Phytophthora idaei]
MEVSKSAWLWRACPLRAPLRHMRSCCARSSGVTKLDFLGDEDDRALGALPVLLGFLLPVVARAKHDRALGLFRALPVFDLPGALVDQHDRAHDPTVELYGHVAAQCLYAECSLAGRMSSWKVWRELSLCVSCPSTFLLRIGHGCPPPSCLFSLALATLPSEVPPGQQ